MRPASLTVLLVEDDPTDIAVIDAQLRAAGDGEVAVDSAASLVDALAKVRAGQYDAAILDLGLPDSSGLSTYRAFRDAAPALPVMVLTATEDDHLALAALREGAQDYLVKTAVTPPTLLSALRFAIERQQAADDRRASPLREAQERLLQRIGGEGAAGAADEAQVAGALGSGVLASVVDRFAQVVDLILDQRLFGVSHDVTDRLRRMAAELVAVNGGARDVVEIYQRALSRKQAAGLSRERLEAMGDGARLAAFELMGLLTEAYRRKST